MAIGAQMADIARLVLSRGVRLGLWGTAVGFVGAAALARVLVAAVPSLGAGQPSIIVAVWGLLMGVVLLACWAPALRAPRVDPRWPFGTNDAPDGRLMAFSVRTGRVRGGTT